MEAESPPGAKRSTAPSRRDWIDRLISNLFVQICVPLLLITVIWEVPPMISAATRSVFSTKSTVPVTGATIIQTAAPSLVESHDPSSTSTTVRSSVSTNSTNAAPLDKVPALESTMPANRLPKSSLAMRDTITSDFYSSASDHPWVKQDVCGRCQDDEDDGDWTLVPEHLWASITGFNPPALPAQTSSIWAHGPSGASPSTDPPPSTSATPSAYATVTHAQPAVAMREMADATRLAEVLDSSTPPRRQTVKTPLSSTTKPTMSAFAAAATTSRRLATGLIPASKQNRAEQAWASANDAVTREQMRQKALIDRRDAPRDSTPDHTAQAVERRGPQDPPQILQLALHALAKQSIETPKPLVTGARAPDSQGEKA